MTSLVECLGPARAGTVFQDLLAYLLVFAGYGSLRINPVGVPDIELSGWKTTARIADVSEDSENTLGEFLEDGAPAVTITVTSEQLRQITESCQSCGHEDLAELLARAGPSDVLLAVDDESSGNLEEAMTTSRGSSAGATSLCPLGGPQFCSGGRVSACSADPVICKAVFGKTVIEFDYDDVHRIVEPHYYGRNSRDNAALAAYQTNVGGKKNTQPGWREYLVDKVSHLHVTTSQFVRPRDGYNPNDSRMNGYFARVD